MRRSLPLSAIALLVAVAVQAADQPKKTNEAE